MVCVTIDSGRRTDLHVIHHSGLTAVWHRDKILSPHVVSMVAAIDPSLNFMHDVRSHRAQPVCMLESIKSMAWPTCFLDLNSKGLALHLGRTSNNSSTVEHCPPE